MRQVGTALLFKRIDLDRSGGVSLEEFTLNLKETNDFVHDARTRERFEAADASADGAISEGEFAAARPLAGITFLAADLDRSESLNKSEVRAALMRIGDFHTNKQFDYKFQSLDADRDGVVSRSEYDLAPMSTMNVYHLQNPPAAFQSNSGEGVRLLIHPSHYISASFDTVIQFTIQNPPLPHAEQPIMIRAACDACKCQDELCSVKGPQVFLEQRMKMHCSHSICESDAAFKLEDPALVVSGSISEATRINGARNVLTLDFHVSHVLPPGGGILVAGLP